MGGWAGAIRGGLAGLNEAAGNTRIAQNLENINAQARQKKELPIQQSLAAHQMAIRGLQSKLSTLQEGTPEYNDTVGQIQQNIHAMREIVAPDQKLGAMDWLERHTTDRMHITNHDKRMRQLAARQQAGNSQDQGTAAALAQGTVPYTETPAYLTEAEKSRSAQEIEKMRAESAERISKEKENAAILAQKATESYRQASLAFDEAKVKYANDPNNPINKARIQEAQARMMSAQAAMLRAKQGPSQAGTWSLAEGLNGEPILFNSKTAQTQPAPRGMEPKGWNEKYIAPLDSAASNIQAYMQGGAFDGAGDLALQHEFFTATQPATGFRMTKVQQDILQESRSWLGSWKAKALHAATGQWFTDEQRKQIAKAALQAIDEKKKSLQGGNQSAAGKVKMRAPNGQTKEVDAKDVDHYKSLGAVVVQ